MNCASFAKMLGEPEPPEGAESDECIVHLRACAECRQRLISASTISVTRAINKFRPALASLMGEFAATMATQLDKSLAQKDITMVQLAKAMAKSIHALVSAA